MAPDPLADLRGVARRRLRVGHQGRARRLELRQLRREKVQLRPRAQQPGLHAVRQRRAIPAAPGSEPRPGHQPPKRGRRGEPDLISVKELALGLPADAWHTVKWREGTADWLSSRFARVRVRAGHHHELTESLPEEWLLIEWPKDEDAPTKYWLSTLPEDISFCDLVDTAKLRWRIERDYQELKQEVGLGHYEGRGWRGFHHHATLCIAAYGFLVSERETIPPSGPASATFFPELAVPDGYRPRGSAIAA